MEYIIYMYIIGIQKTDVQGQVFSFRSQQTADITWSIDNRGAFKLSHILSMTRFRFKLWVAA